MSEQKDSLQELKKLIDDYQEALAEVEYLEEKLSHAKAREEILGGDLIPKHLKEAGLSEVRLDDKRKVTVSKDIRVAVKDEDALHKYLEKQGAGHYIKFNLSTDKLSDAQRKSLFDTLATSGIEYTSDNKVNGNSLKKYLKDILGLNLSEEQYATALKDGIIADKDEVSKLVDIRNINKTKIK